jgi:hypothetical protein
MDAAGNANLANRDNIQADHGPERLPPEAFFFVFHYILKP